MSTDNLSDADRELLANLKQDERNAKQNNESQATKEHLAGASGKLATAISQREGDSDINTGGQRIARDIEPSGGEVDRDAVQQELRDRAKAEISGKEMHIEKCSEAARLQSAAEQYDLAREGKQSQPESHLDKE